MGLKSKRLFTKITCKICDWTKTIEFDFKTSDEAALEFSQKIMNEHGKKHGIPGSTLQHVSNMKVRKN